MTAFARLHIAERELMAAFVQLREFSGHVRMAEVAVEGRIKSNFQNYIQAISGRLRQSLKDYSLNFEGDILEFRTGPC